MLKKSPPPDSDATEEIIDLTEIIQKGKPPLQSKDVVDFDSALSDLMGKVPAVKLEETPELQELLSGIDEVAQTREKHKPDSDRVINLSDMDDVDSLVSALETPRPDKNRQPAEEVDSLLDSLMGDLPPTDAGHKSTGPEISEDDIEDLLNTIEQESSGKEAPAKAADYSMDDLLSGLDKVHAKGPAGGAEPASDEAADDAAGNADDGLDDLFNAMEGDAKADPRKVEAPIESLDDLLNGLDLPAAKPAAKPADKPAAKAAEKPAEKAAPAEPADLDDLLAGLDLPADKPAAKAVDKPAEKAAPAEPADLDDLLAGLDLPADKPAAKAAEKAAPAEPADLDDLLAGLDLPADKPAAKAVDKPAEKAAPAAPADLDDLLAGLDLPADKPAAKAVDKPAEKAAPAAQDERVDFGDLAAAFSQDLADDEASDASLDDGAADTDHAEGAEGAFDAADFDELDSLFGNAGSGASDNADASADAASDRAGDTESDFASDRVDMPESVAAAPAAASVAAAPAVEPAATGTGLTVSGDELAGLLARMDEMEAELHDLRGKVAALEAREPVAAPEPEAAADPVIDTLADGLAALEDRVATLETTVPATAPTSGLDPEDVEALPGKVTVLESRVAALETTLTQVAAQAAAPREEGAAMEALESLSRRVQVLEERLQDSGWGGQEAVTGLEQRLEALESRPYVPVETIQGAFDQMGAQINGPLQHFQNRITALEQRLGENLALLAEELAPLMSGSIDRAAAESAARALREELAAMLGDEGDADEGDADGGDADEDGVLEGDEDGMVESDEDGMVEDGTHNAAVPAAAQDGDPLDPEELADAEDAENAADAEDAADAAGPGDMDSAATDMAAPSREPTPTGEADLLADLDLFDTAIPAAPPAVLSKTRS